MSASKYINTACEKDILRSYTYYSGAGTAYPSTPSEFTPILLVGFVCCWIVSFRFFLMDHWYF